MTPPIITLEEHFFSSAISPSLKALYSEQLKNIPDIMEKLSDIGPIRLQHMEKGRVSLQVISHAPGLTSNPFACRAANDQLAKTIAAEKEARGSAGSRFAGFACLPMGDPAGAAQELRRCVTELGFVGALVDAHHNGKFYDGMAYDVFWATLEELGVPLYLHPTWPSENDVGVLGRYATDQSNDGTGLLTDAAARSIGSSGWGWHSDTAVHVFRLFGAGAFDRWPKLKIIIGHFGEMIPFMLERIVVLSKRWGDRKRDFRAVWDENIWITTSGVWSLDPMRCILHNTKIDHILYSVDYPFQSNEVGLNWISELEKSGLVDREQLEAIAHRNAEKLLGISAPV